MNDGTADLCVIIPCYNSSSTIARALESVASQSLLPRQVVIVDDGSRNSERAALRRIVAESPLAHRTQLLELTTNQGVASARNAGWDCATTIWVAFLDSDDAWHPQKTERQMPYLSAGYDLVGTRRSLASSMNALGALLSGSAEYRSITRRQILLRNYFATSTVIIRSDIPERFTPGRRFGEDYELWLRVVLRAGRAALVTEELAYSYKGPVGEGGLSGHVLAMTFAELATYTKLFQDRLITPTECAVALAVSLVRACRRIFLFGLHTLRRRF